MRYHRVLLAVALLACADSTPPEASGGVHFVGLPATDLTGTVGASATPTPTVSATDATGKPVPGIWMSFAASDLGTVLNDSALTDAAGVATPGGWTLGTVAGEQYLTARSGGQIVAQFTARAAAGPVVSVTRAGGDTQLAAPGAPLPTPLRVRVTDRFGNVVPAALVAFTVLSGDGSIEPNTAVTDSQGIATSGIWTLGSVLGAQTARAESAEASVVLGALAYDGNATILFVRNDSIYRSTVPAGQTIAMTRGVDPAWSPDGSRIAFARDDGSRFDIFLMNADGSGITRRTDRGGENHGFAGLYAPTWSPDGARLAVMAGGLYEGEIYVLHVDDDGVDPILIQEMAADPSWSPDGSRIAFVRLSGDDGYHSLQIMDPDGSNVRVVTPLDPGALYGPQWSPDGSRIVFTKCISGGCELYTVAADGSDFSRLTRLGDAATPAWSPDGGVIAFTLSTSGTTSIALVPLATGGDPFVLACGFSPAWRP